MIEIPLLNVSSQILQVNLSNQNCQINLYTKNENLYFDLAVNDTNIVIGVLCQDNNILINRDYLNFIGNLLFLDTQGNDKPNYLELGTRWKLFYLDESENVLIQ